MVLAKATGDFWLKGSRKNTFLYKNLPIMSYISVAQYASSEDTKKTAPKSSLFCIVEKVLRVLKVFKSNISRN